MDQRPCWGNLRPAPHDLGAARNEDDWLASDECVAQFAEKDAWDQIMNPAGKPPLYYAVNSTRVSDRLEAWLVASSQSLLSAVDLNDSRHSSPAMKRSRRRPKPPAAAPINHGQMASWQGAEASQASSSTHKGGWDLLVQQAEARARPDVDITDLPPPGFSHLDRRTPPKAFNDACREKPAAVMYADSQQSCSNDCRGRRCRHNRQGAWGKQPKQEQVYNRTVHGNTQRIPQINPKPGSFKPLHDVIADMPWVTTWKPEPKPQKQGWSGVEQSGADWMVAVQTSLAGPQERNIFAEKGYWTSSPSTAT